MSSCRKDAEGVCKGHSGLAYTIFGGKPSVRTSCGLCVGEVHEVIRNLLDNSKSGQTVLLYLGHSIPKGEEFYLAIPQVNPKAKEKVISNGDIKL